MKNTICIFFSGNKIEKLLSVYNDLIRSIPSKYEKFYLINFYKIMNNNQIDLNDYQKYEVQYNIKIICPKDIKEFNDFVEKRFIFAFDNLGKNFDYFRVRSIINRKNIKLILLQNIGYFSNQVALEKNISIKNFLYLIKTNFTKKLFRLLVFFKIFAPIYLYFECRKEIVENCQKHEKKFQKKHFFNYLFFQNTIMINSRSYDFFLKKSLVNSEEKIVFIDGNYQHLDVLKRENFNIEKLKNEYFSHLKKLLKDISNILNKEIIICLHPTSNLNEYKRFFDEFELSQFETEKNIYKSFIVIFHESSSIDTAIFLKKKIISLETSLFGKYFTNRIRKYQKSLGLMSLSLNDKLKLKKNELMDKIKVNEIKYNDYISSYLKADQNEKGVIKVYRVLSEHFNLVKQSYEK
ncbi:hypothetical protein OA046_01730 [Candidatus Pelagibacter sp.]|nr:hypothetical protein [Candidatus Pelagibacter sp.]